MIGRRQQYSSMGGAVATIGGGELFGASPRIWLVHSNS